MYLASFCFSAIHVDLAKVLTGQWYINSTIFPNASPSSESATLSMVFAPDTTNPSILRGVLTPPFNHIESLVITFTGQGVFVVNDGATDVRLGEFEFFATLMPHVTAVGQWRTASVFSANVVSQTSLHLSIIDENATSFFVFSKDSPKLQKTFLEKHLLLVLAVGVFLFRIVRTEFKTRSRQLKQKAESEAQTARFEKEQADGQDS
jgi:hypothetical protein